MTDSPVAPAAVRGCTCNRLRRLTRRVTAIYDRELAAAGLRVTQYSLLAQLRAAPDASMSHLAELLDMDRTTLTRNLKPLVAAGWVRLAPSATDARAQAVNITAAGEAHWQAARAHWRRAQDEINATLGHDEVAALHSLLDTYVEHFRSPTEEYPQ